MEPTTTTPEARALFRDILLNELPPILFRNDPQFKKLTGLSPRSVANDDSRRLGPSQRVVIGKVTGYPKEALISYLETKIR